MQQAALWQMSMWFSCCASYWQAKASRRRMWVRVPPVAFAKRFKNKLIGLKTKNKYNNNNKTKKKKKKKQNDSL